MVHRHKKSTEACPAEYSLLNISLWWLSLFSSVLLLLVFIPTPFILHCAFGQVPLVSNSTLSIVLCRSFTQVHKYALQFLNHRVLRPYYSGNCHSSTYSTTSWLSRPVNSAAKVASSESHYNEYASRRRPSLSKLPLASSTKGEGAAGEQAGWQVSSCTVPCSL